MVLVGVDVAGSEQDGEHRHADRHPEPRADVEVARRDAQQRGAGGVGDHLEAGGDRLELQGDVGGGADHRDQGHQHRQRGALAVARGDQVADRRRPVDPADPHQLAQQEPPPDEHQGRAEIDGGELQPVARRRADRAVERPGGAVDRDRQGVDHRRVHQAEPALAGPRVADEGDQEQHGDVGERCEQDDVGGQHHGGPPPPIPSSPPSSRRARRCGSIGSRRDSAQARTISASQTPKT